MRGKRTGPFLCFLTIATMVFAMAVFSGGAAAQSSSEVWGFDAPGDYTFNSELIDVSGSQASLLSLPSGSYWARRYLRSGVTFCEYNAAALDPDGNIVVVGSAFNAAGGRELMLAKYNSSGGMLSGWPKFYKRSPAVIPDANQSNNAFDIFIEDNGNISVAGRSQDNGVNIDMAVWRFDPGGSHLAGWPVYKSGTPNDAAVGVTVDSDGNIIACGFDQVVAPYQLVLLKYGPDGTLAAGWPKTWSPGSGAQSYDVIQDASGDYVVAGAAVLGGFVPDGILAKFDVQGNMKSGWPRSWDRGIGATDYFFAISQDRNEEYCVVGMSNDASANWDVVTARFSSNGSMVSGWPVFYDRDSIGPINYIRGYVDTAGNRAGREKLDRGLGGKLLPD